MDWQFFAPAEKREEGVALIEALRGKWRSFGQQGVAFHCKIVYANSRILVAWDKTISGYFAENVTLASSLGGPEGATMNSSRAGLMSMLLLLAAETSATCPSALR